MREIDETPDPTRPGNVWPRLLAFGAVVAVAVVVVGACVAAFAGSVPDRELEISADQLDPGIPRLLPVTIWGSDAAGSTFGAWVLLMPDGSGPRAYLSRDPGSGCHVRWSNGAAGGPVDVFLDPCDGSQYGRDGEHRSGPATRGLDRFDVRIEDGAIVIAIEEVVAGACAGAAPPDCSGTTPVRRDLPSGTLGRSGGFR